MVTVKSGDLLEATENIICHQVNCFGAAGGLAFDMFERFPDAADQYYAIVDDYRDKMMRQDLLGCAQVVVVGHLRYVANVFGQYYSGSDYRPDELRKALKVVAGFAKDNGLSVAIPHKLSCGICGGDWDEVFQIIEEVFEDVECVIYKRV